MEKDFIRNNVYTYNKKKKRVSLYLNHQQIERKAVSWLNTKKIGMIGGHRPPLRRQK